jgi:hypothetical protein
MNDLSDVYKTRAINLIYIFHIDSLTFESVFNLQFNLANLLWKTFLYEKYGPLVVEGPSLEHW